MKFPSEGEFWNCHFAGYKMGASNQMFQAKLESENKKISKVRHSVPPTVNLKPAGKKWIFSKNSFRFGIFGAQCASLKYSEVDLEKIPNLDTPEK